MRISLRSYGTIELATRTCRMETGAMIDPVTIAFYQERAPHSVCIVNRDFEH